MRFPTYVLKRATNQVLPHHILQRSYNLLFFIPFGASQGTKYYMRDLINTIHIAARENRTIKTNEDRKAKRSYQ